jgi:hypothetical protein
MVIRSVIANRTGLLILILTLGLVALIPTSRAEEESFSWFSVTKRTSEVAANYLMMENAAGQSLIGTGSGSGYGLSFTTSAASSAGSLYGRARFQYGMGTAELEDGSESRSLAFALLQAEAHLGLRVFLLPTAAPRIQPFFGVAGKAALLHLTLPSVPDDSETLSKASIAQSFGLEFTTGVMLGSSLLVEVQLSQIPAAFAGLDSASVGGLSVSVGYRW